MNPIDKLAEYFKQFPGIGERQSKRFVYFLLTKDKQYLESLSDAIMHVKDGVRICPLCQRFFSGPQEVCLFCTTAEDTTSLLIVEKDADLEAFRKSKTYNGFYFVLGGLVPILEKNPSEFLRLREMVKRVTDLKKTGLKEIVLAFSLTPSGTHTDEYIRNTLKNYIEGTDIKLVSLGRGLSTGTELEYSDADTIKYALRNRQ
jgi:recombination protein RecR